MDGLTKETRERRNRKKKVRKSKTVRLESIRRTRKHYSNQNIGRFLKERYCDDAGSGNPITLKHDDGKLRVMFQNPRGVFKPNKGNKSRRDGVLDAG